MARTKGEAVSDSFQLDVLIGELVAAMAPGADGYRPCVGDVYLLERAKAARDAGAAAERARVVAWRRRVHGTCSASYNRDLGRGMDMQTSYMRTRRDAFAYALDEIERGEHVSKP